MQLTEQKKSLETLIKLEQKNYVHEKVVAALQWEIDSIAEKRNFVRPAWVRRSRGARLEGITAVICCIIGAVSASAGFFCGETLYKVFFWLAGILMMWFGITFFREYQQEMSRAKASYEAKLAHYNLKVENEEKRLAEELPRKRHLQELQESLRTEENQTRVEKEEIYTRMGVPLQYRGYIPVCTLYQYLADGKCRALDGEDGAYNYYDNDENICRDLNAAVQQTENVKKYQHVLYDSLEEADQMAKDIMTSIYGKTDSEEH